MADYMLTSDGRLVEGEVLFHSEDIAYIDLDEDELMHWKYIKKKKLPNGKWRYYYDSKQLKKDLGITQRKEYLDQQQKLQIAQQKSKDVTQELRTYVKNTDYKDWDRDTIKNLQRDTDIYFDIAQRRGLEYMKARNAYLNTPLGKTAEIEETLKRGAKAVSKWLKKLVKKST